MPASQPKIEDNFDDRTRAGTRDLAFSRIQVPETVRRILQNPSVRPVADIDYAGGPFLERYLITYDTPA
jgi:hypothetical protein